MSPRLRFGQRSLPLPRGAAGKHFFQDDDALRRLVRVFEWLAAEPGLAVLTGEPGVGKTCALRHLCAQLPRPAHRVLYLADTAVHPTTLYRMLAAELGLRPGLRSTLLVDIKHVAIELVDERGVQPVLLVDDAHLLHDDVLREIAVLLNFDLDGRDLLTVWLVGHPLLERRLQMHAHAALAQRVVHYVRLAPKTDRAVFDAMIAHAMSAAGALTPLLSDAAAALLFRASRGVPRVAAHLLRSALFLADERGQPRRAHPPRRHRRPAHHARNEQSCHPGRPESPHAIRNESPQINRDDTRFSGSARGGAGTGHSGQDQLRRKWRPGDSAV